MHVCVYDSQISVLHQQNCVLQYFFLHDWNSCSNDEFHSWLKKSPTGSARKEDPRPRFTKKFIFSGFISVPMAYPGSKIHCPRLRNTLRESGNLFPKSHSKFCWNGIAVVSSPLQSLDILKNNFQGRLHFFFKVHFLGRVNDLFCSIFPLLYN